MPHWRKCVLGCEGDYPLFTLPKDATIRQKWLDFIFGDFPPPKKNWYICARHFTDDSFLNKGLFDKGLIGRLSLLDHAIPTRLKPFEWGQVSETTTHIVLLLFFERSMVVTKITMCILELFYYQAETSCKNLCTRSGFMGLFAQGLPMSRYSCHFI